jgi:copper chaperone CopZ
VCEALAELEGVAEAECDLSVGVLRVTRDPKQLSGAALESALRRIVVEAADGVAHAAYRITGLD